MVAPMYRGNLHRVPDVPRRWLMPTHKLSIKDFKSLLRRRKQALSRLRPNPHSFRVQEPAKSTEAPSLSVEPKVVEPAKLIEAPSSSAEPKLIEEKIEEIRADQVKEGDTKRDDVRVREGTSDGGDCSVKPPELHPKKEADDAVVGDGNQYVVEKPADEGTEKAEANKRGDAVTDRDKRKREVEEKLQVLNAKKHNLVQVLKQILNTEEELKRRNSTQQGITPTRPSHPLQVEVSNDSGANFGGHVEGETEDTSNQKVQPRHLFRVSSVSPSSESPLIRPAFMQHSMIPHPSRASPQTTAPTGHQAQPGNPPTVSVSGTNYIPSSPSPAASGVSSVFRDSRIPSPWN